MTDPRRRRSQLGLTLIELMLSIAIGLVVVGAVTYLYVGSRGAYRGNEALARIQEAGRFGLDSITRDIRRSGALGCGSRLSVASGQPINVNVIAPAGLTVDAASAIAGFTTGWVQPTGAPTYSKGDVLQLQIARGAPVRVLDASGSAAGTVTIASNKADDGSENFKVADYAVLASCSAALVLGVTASPGAVTNATLGVSPGGLMPGVAGDNYATTIQHFDQVTYYIGTAPNSTRSALYRYSRRDGAAEELVENIEDMEVVYGIATAGTITSPTGTGVAITAFKHADTMVAGATGDWPNVVSVRVSLMAVSDQPGAAAPRQVLQFRGASLIAPDTRLRQVFTGTAAVRDRVQ